MALRSRALWAKYTELLGGFGPQMVQDLPTDPGPLSYLLTTAVVMPLPERQGLLAAPTDSARLTAVNHYLQQEVADHDRRAVTAPARRGRPAELSTAGRGRPALVAGLRGVRRPSRKWASDLHHDPDRGEDHRRHQHRDRRVQRQRGDRRLHAGVQLAPERVRAEPAADPPGDQPGGRRADQPGDDAGHRACAGSAPASATDSRAPARRPEDAEPAVLGGEQVVVPGEVDRAVDDLGRPQWGRSTTRADPTPGRPPGSVPAPRPAPARDRRDVPAPAGPGWGGGVRRPRRRLDPAEALPGRPSSSGLSGLADRPTNRSRGPG